MKKLLSILLFALFASACGPKPVPADEVTERWTAGDDAPLEEASSDR